jgi:hypothetical protein
MHGMKSHDMVSIVDFIYNGEVKIHQDDLQRFLAIANEMEIKGLNSSTNQKSQRDSVKSSPKEKKKIFSQNDNMQNRENESQESKAYIIPDHTLTSYKGNEQYLDSMIKSCAGIWTCTVCVTGMTHKTSLRKYIKTHIEESSYPKIKYLSEATQEKESNIFEDEIEAVKTINITEKKQDISNEKFAEENIVDTIPNILHQPVSLYDESVTSMMGRGSRGKNWNCKICGVEKKSKNCIRIHMEVHIDGVTYPCHKCGNKYKSIGGYRKHTRKGVCDIYKNIKRSRIHKK